MADQMKRLTCHSWEHYVSQTVEAGFVRLRLALYKPFMQRQGVAGIPRPQNTLCHLRSTHDLERQLLTKHILKASRSLLRAEAMLRRRPLRGNEEDSPTVHLEAT